MGKKEMRDSERRRSKTRKREICAEGSGERRRQSK
jgi:hypothetical protein